MLTLAIAQSHVDRAVPANGAHIRALMREAAAHGARLIQFPEGALTGYAKSEVADWVEVDWAETDRELAATAALAGELGLWTVLGAAHRLPPPHRPHNSLYVLSPAGVVAHRYDKRFCSHTELSDWYTPGRDPVVFEVDGVKFGCALCIEVQFPTLFAAYEALDVDCVLLSAYAKDPMFWTQAQGHAACNNLWVALASVALYKDRLPGGLIGPDGHPVARHDATQGPGLSLAQIDRADPAFEIALTKARPWRRRAREGSMYRERWIAP